MRSDLLKWLNLVGFVTVVAVNSIVAATGLIGGKTTAQVSDAYPTLVTPAGYVFSIWSVIYVLLGVFAIAQALPRDYARVYREKIGWLFVLSCIFNIAWLFLWQFELLPASVVVMFLLLSTIILIYTRLGIGRSTVKPWEWIAFHLPFSVYLGWITIASIANVATALASVNWDGFGLSPETWAILIIAVAVLITSLVVVTRRDVAYGLVVVWALLGIAAKQSTYPTIVTAAQASAAIVGAIILIATLYTKLKR
jgi:hypothetical protein